MWESPINLIMNDMKTELVKRQEEQVLRAVQSIGVDVDKEELIRALNYDRDQYEKGYRDAMAELVRCKDCKHWYPDADCGMACEFTNMSQPEDGYCNWGVRKDGRQKNIK